MPDRDHLLENARAQIAAARALSMRDEVEAVHFLGPALLLVGFGIEAFLKAVLLNAEIAASKLKNPPYGHDLWSMWQLEKMEEQREQAGLLSEACNQDLIASYPRSQNRLPANPDFVPNLQRYVPAPSDFEKHLKHLSDLHSSQSVFALRYPVGHETVPDPMLLICVFERLIGNYRNDMTIVRAQ